MFCMPGEREQNGYKEVQSDVWYREAPSPFKAGTMSPPLLYVEDNTVDPIGEIENVNEYVPPQVYDVDRGNAPYGIPWTSAGERTIEVEVILGSSSITAQFIDDNKLGHSVVRVSYSEERGRNPKWCCLPNLRKVSGKGSHGSGARDRPEAKIA